MIAELRKTVRRTGSYLARAVVFGEPYRDQVVVVWLLIAGLLWIVLDAPFDPMAIILIVLGGVLVALLAAICAIDARFGIIPDQLVGAMAACGLVSVWLLDPDEIMDRLVEAVVAALAIAAFRAIYRWVRGYDGLGFGDVKFLAAATFWIGLGSLPAALLVAVASALVSAFVLRSSRYEVDGRHAIPFGPHLAVGVWLAWVFDPMAFLFR